VATGVALEKWDWQVYAFVIFWAAILILLPFLKISGVWPHAFRLTLTFINAEMSMPFWREAGLAPWQYFALITATGTSFLTSFFLLLSSPSAEHIGWIQLIYRRLKADFDMADGGFLNRLARAYARFAIYLCGLAFGIWIIGFLFSRALKIREGIVLLYLGNITKMAIFAFVYGLVFSSSVFEVWLAAAALVVVPIALRYLAKLAHRLFKQTISRKS